MNPYPLLLDPILKPRVWGGRELARLGKALPAGERIGESWEVADLPDNVEEGRSVIANGALRGRTLREAIAAHRTAIMGIGRMTTDGGFPLLVKYLDARRNLSVQVHPTEAYAAAHPGAAVKNEAWVVIEAEPDAVIYRGLRPGVTREALAEDLRTGAVPDDLVAYPARPGDCHALPSGTVHALGAGIIVAEVQTPSDTTFRVYDWGRSGRELHIEQALACIDFGPGGGEAARPAQPVEVDRLWTIPLVETDDFAVERVKVADESSGAELNVITNDMPVIWMVIAGSGRLRGGGVEVDLRPGTTVLNPAALADGRATLEAGCALLRVSLPSPIRGAIA